MIKIYLGNGYFTEVDDHNVLWLFSLCENWWCQDHRNPANRYALGYIKGKNTPMHTVIAQKIGLKGLIDHKDRDKLNNQEENLRECRSGQNRINASLGSNNSSGYSGVTFNKDQQKWAARINVNDLRLHLGYFINKEDAIQARKAAEKRYFGEFSPENREPIIHQPIDLKPEIVNTTIVLTPEEEAVELIPMNNSTGYRGISHDKHNNSYRVSVTRKSLRETESYILTIDDAIKIYKKMYYRMYKR